MGTKKPPKDPQMSVEEEGPTRLDYLSSSRSHQTTDEVQRKRQEGKQKGLPEPMYIMEVFTNCEEWSSNKRQSFRIYCTPAQSESETDMICRKLTNMECKMYKGLEVPYWHPPTNDDKYRAKLPNAESLRIQIEGLDSTKCFILRAPQGNLEDIFTRQEIESLKWQPCISFDLVCNDQYSYVTMTNFTIITTCFDVNGSEIDNKTIKYAIKFSSEAMKNTPSEHSWQDEASSPRHNVTQRKELLESVFKDTNIYEKIENIEHVTKILHTDLGQTGNLGELLQIVIYHDDGIGMLIRALESTTEGNMEIAQQLKDIFKKTMS